MANGDIPTCHHYHPVKHGQNLADGASGRVKLAFKRGKLSHEATIRNAQELYEYTSQAMDNCNVDNNSCNHFRTKIMFKENIERKMFPKSEIVTDTHKIHCVCSTGIKDWVQVQFTTCCCLNCMSKSVKCMYPDL